MQQVTKLKKHNDPQLAEARRTQILNAAASCFMLRGYHGASMADISKAAGMSPGHIYNYFDSKESIIEALIARDREEMFDLFNRIEAQGGNLLESLVEAADEGVERKYTPEHSALQLEMLAEAARNPKIAQLLQESDQVARARMRQLLTNLRQQQGVDIEKNLDGTIEVIFAFFGGLLGRSVLHPALARATLLAVMRPTLRQLFLGNSLF